MYYSNHYLLDANLFNQYNTFKQDKLKIFSGIICGRGKNMKEITYLLNLLLKVFNITLHIIWHVSGIFEAKLNNIKQLILLLFKYKDISLNIL